jgi:hypothetical protein
VRGFKSNLPGFFYITVCQDFLGNG